MSSEDLRFDRFQVADGTIRVVVDRIPLFRFNTEFDYVSCSRIMDKTVDFIGNDRNLVMRLSVSALVSSFRFLQVKMLMRLCAFHGADFERTTRLEPLRMVLMDHVCGPLCMNLIYTFRGRARPRGNIIHMFSRSTMGITVPKGSTGPGNMRTSSIDEEEEDIDVGNEEFLDICDDTLRLSIIEEWQTVMSTDQLRRLVCAVCARMTPCSNIIRMNSAEIPLRLLRNDELPSYVLPRDYNIAAYDMAILHPDGLVDRERSSTMLVCVECSESLRKLVMPRFALANWLYYGHSALPGNVEAAFRNATAFDLMLVARARASTICFRFGSYFGAEMTPGDTGSSMAKSRRGVRGNVMVTPLDATRLFDVLPPGPETIRDTVCAVFVGRSKPSRDTVSRMRPILVRRSRVKLMIEFLLDFNPHYAKVDGFKGFSAENLGLLFDDVDSGSDEAVPCNMGWGHLPLNDAVIAATADYTPRNEYDMGSGEILMENVGFTTGDDSPVSYRDMKMKALGHCLTGGAFISSRRGTKPIPDFDNPYLMSWLFPHLDPWGIGGFHHPARKIKLSMIDQLSYLLQVQGARFERDPEFAFVYYNIRQKMMVSQSIRFKAPERHYGRLVRELMDVDPDTLANLRAKFKSDPTFRPIIESEVGILRLLASINMITGNVPGSAAYKVSRRNEIRGVINFRGAPTLFITINPSDVDHPLVRLNVGQDINLEDVARGEDMDKWSRMILAARNPSACASFFHTMISTFITVILRPGGVRNGVFGRCTSYYGTVEANGRGTLHCHMLVWLRGHPGPQLLRDRMLASEAYRNKTFRWLESIIKCELMGSTETTVENNGPLDKPRRSTETGDPHPGTIPAPAVDGMTDADEFRHDYNGFVNALIKEYNWHVHTASCWKHLKRGQTRDDHNCRMGIDGHTCAETMLDPETSSILLRRLHPRIGSYNDLVIFLMKCNMDVKFIGSGEAAKAYLYYLTDYITKPSLPVHVGLSALSYAIVQTNARVPSASDNISESSGENNRGAMTIAVNSMMGHQEVSHQQVMSYLVGGGDYYSPDEFRVLYWSAFIRLLPLQDTRLPSVSEEVTATVVRNPSGTESEMHLGTDTENAELNASEPTIVIQLGHRSITGSNQVLDYTYRSVESTFDDMCLYEFVERVKKFKIPKRPGSIIWGASQRRLAPIPGRFSDKRHPQYCSHILVRHTKRCIPVILGERFPRRDKGPEEFELWAKSVLLLFVPWRDPEELKHGFVDWTSAYAERKTFIKSRYEQVILNLNVLTECRDVRGDQARAWRAERQKQMGGFDMEDALESLVESIEARPKANAFDEFGSEFENNGAIDDDETNINLTVLGTQGNNSLDYCLLVSGDGSNAVASNPAVATELLDEDRCVVGRHAAGMASLKRKRRPEVLDLGGTLDVPNQRSRHTSDIDPLSSIEILVSGNAVRGPSGMGAVDKDAEAWSVVERVIEEMHVNDNREQCRAIRIIAKHVIAGGPQLLMYVAGVGGTGKSHLIKTFVLLMDRLGRRNELLLGAPTGIAAVLIGGYTMHSLSMTSPHRKSKSSQELVALWRGVNYLVIDEISMVGALFLSQFSSRLQQAKSEDPSCAVKPFGGVHVIFMGDFGQLKPPRQHSLFAHQLVDNPSFEESKHPDGVNAMNGAFLWRQVSVVVKLVKNHRHATDHAYAAFLDRVRLGECKAPTAQSNLSHTEDDLQFLRQRDISRLAGIDAVSLGQFRDAPVIVGSRDVRDAVNAKYVAYHSKRLGQSVTLYHAEDRVHRTLVSGGIRELLWSLSSRVTNDSAGRLPLFSGMKVMITENIAFSKGIVNGVEGVVEDVKYVTEDGRRTATVAYVRVPGVGVIIPDLGVDIVPVFPETSSFEFKYAKEGCVKTRTVSRKQLPLLPAYSYTDFKSQGRTLDKVVVDLYTARGQGVYVMLSRAKTLSGIAIMRWFPSTKIYQRNSEDLRDELERIDYLDGVTARAYLYGIV